MSESVKTITVDEIVEKYTALKVAGKFVYLGKKFPGKLSDFEAGKTYNVVVWNSGKADYINSVPDSATNTVAAKTNIVAAAKPKTVAQPTQTVKTTDEEKMSKGDWQRKDQMKTICGLLQNAFHAAASYSPTVDEFNTNAWKIAQEGYKKIWGEEYK